jgi:hypothetical protein
MTALTHETGSRCAAAARWLGMCSDGGIANVRS